VKAFIAGTSLMKSGLFKHWTEELVDTPFGRVAVLRASQYLFLQRHGKKSAPAHNINHHANIWALKSKGVEGIIAVNSVGSLKSSLKPGTFLIPDDFFCPWTIPTFFESEARYMVPSMDPEYAQKMYNVCNAFGVESVLGGVYIQTKGPRFETKAEVNVLKKIGDVVGMTMASEATLCMECSIPYVSLCSVDNYCNGIAKNPLSIEEVEQQIAASSETIELLVRTILAEGF
jgi:5'-methylthioadenosine phosphorylase